MVLDLSNVTNNGTIAYGISRYTNDFVGGLLFNGGLIVFFIIILFASNKYNVPFVQSLAIASWCMFVVSIFTLAASLTLGAFTVGFLGVAVFSTIIFFTTP